MTMNEIICVMLLLTEPKLSLACLNENSHMHYWICFTYNIDINEQIGDYKLGSHFIAASNEKCFPTSFWRGLNSFPFDAMAVGETKTNPFPIKATSFFFRLKIFVLLRRERDIVRIFQKHFSMK